MAWNTREGSGHPAEFVAKLYGMLDKLEYVGIVSWSEARDSFIILDLPAFQEEVIPREFNHRNFSSFVRQLNKYDFHKQRYPGSKAKVWEFKHENFCYSNRDAPHLIKRKLQSARNQSFKESLEELQGQMEEIRDHLIELEEENIRMNELVADQERVISLLMQGSAEGSMEDSVEVPEVPEVSQPAMPPAMPPVMQQMVHPVVQLEHSTLETPPLSSQPPRQAPIGEPVMVAVAMADKEAREVISAMLRDSGCIVESTGSGIELTQLFQGKQLRAVFLEPVLSSLDGFSAIAMIQEADSRVKAIFCVNQEEQDMGRSNEYFHSRGASCVLWRPFSRQDLINALISVL